MFELSRFVRQKNTLAYRNLLQVYDMFHNLRMHASLTWIAALIAHVMTDMDSVRSNTHVNLAVGFVMIYFYISSRYYTRGGRNLVFSRGGTLDFIVQFQRFQLI